jgi:hypothetical protein
MMSILTAEVTGDDGSRTREHRDLRLPFIVITVLW